MFDSGSSAMVLYVFNPGPFDQTTFMINAEVTIKTAYKINLLGGDAQYHL